MSESSILFDSIAGDRLYNAGTFVDWLYQMFQRADGVIKGLDNELTVSGTGTLNSSVGAGSASKKGRMYKNTASLNKAHSAVAIGYKRIDRVVIRFDAVTSRSAFSYVVEGTPVLLGDTAIVPSVDADMDVKLFQVLISNSSSVYSFSYIDERDFRPLFWNDSNDGADSGADADLLDGQHGSYYKNAGNLNAGTLSVDRLPAATAKFLPLGFVYVQFPGLSDPTALFGGTWTNISSSFAGDFFRAEGGNASAFGSGRQSQDIQPHSHTINRSIVTIDGSGWLSASGTLNSLRVDQVSTGVASTSTVGTTETRPVNRTIRVWRLDAY